MPKRPDTNSPTNAHVFCDRKDVWIAPGGNDAASGSSTEPLQTFQEAIKRVENHHQQFPQESITVFFQKGVYPMEKPVLLRGLKASAEKPIRFVAADKGTAILDGGKEISGWEKLSLFRCHAAISFSPWGQRYLDAIAGKPASLSKISLTPKLYEEVDIRSPKWQEKYPELKQIAQDPDFNVVRNNLLVNCANTFLRKPAATKPENTVEIQVENNAKCEPR